jgi:hypothetical protein
MNAKNIIIQKQHYAEIILQNKKPIGCARALINAHKIDLIKFYKWRLDSRGYAVATINGHEIRLHRLIINAADGDLVDHINQNKLDSRDENLRITTASINLHNCGLSIRNTSGVKGVYQNKKSQKWVAKIMVNGKSYCKKGLCTMDEAISIVQKWRSTYLTEV